MKVYGYIRVSGRGQVDGDGPERQREAIEKFCKSVGLAWDGFFVEQITGTSDAAERPEFALLMDSFDDVLPGGRAIVVERMDRLARDLMVSEVLLRECRERGIQVYSADQGVLIDMASDGGDPTRVLIRQIMGALAQWEKSQLVKKLAVARARKKAKTGRCEGYLPLEQIPGGQSTIDLIHHMSSGGMLEANIARLMNSEGSKTRRGKPWTRFSIRYVLKHNKPTNQY